MGVPRLHYADRKGDDMGTSKKRVLSAALVLAFGLAGTGCAAGSTGTAEPSRTPKVPSLADCESAPEEHLEACEIVMEQLEEVKDDTSSMQHSGASCSPRPLTDALAQTMTTAVFDYAGGGGAHHYGAEIDEQSVQMLFKNVYEESYPGVTLWAYPTELLLRDVSTFDSFAAWQAEIDRPATSLDAGDFGWAAHQDLPSEKATYYQMSDDGSMHFLLEFEVGGAWSHRTEPLDVDSTFATAMAMRSAFCG